MTRPFQLGPFVVDPDLLELRRDAEIRRLGPKVLGVLLTLMRAQGGVVGKETLIDEVWEGAFTTDEALSAVVYELRKALDDDARKSQFIETIRGSGYRLPLEASQITEGHRRPVRAEPLASEAPAPLPLQRPAPPPSTPPSSRVLQWRWLAAMLLIGSLALALSLASSRRPTSPTTPAVPSPAIRSLAVLPLAGTLGGAPSEISLAETLTDMLIADLDRMCPVDVASSLSVRGGPPRWSLPEVDRRLGVDAVVEGTVLRSSDRLWVAVQLVETGTGRLLWSHSYDRQGDDDLAILREVALDVASRIGTELQAPPPAVP